jgi:hypothetical protein
MTSTKPQQTITLSFHSSGNGKYRFGINLRESYEHFGCRGRNVVINDGNIILFAQTTCSQHKYNIETNCLKPQKGFDLYSREISEYIYQKIKIKALAVSCLLEEKSNYVLLTVQNCIMESKIKD